MLTVISPPAIIAPPTVSHHTGAFWFLFTLFGYISSFLWSPTPEPLAILSEPSTVTSDHTTSLARSIASEPDPLVLPSISLVLEQLAPASGVVRRTVQELCQLVKASPEYSARTIDTLYRRENPTGVQHEFIVVRCAATDGEPPLWLRIDRAAKRTGQSSLMTDLPPDDSVCSIVDLEPMIYILSISTKIKLNIPIHAGWCYARRGPRVSGWKQSCTGSGPIQHGGRTNALSAGKPSGDSSKREQEV